MGPARPPSVSASIETEQRAAAEALARRDPATLDELERATLEAYYRSGILGTIANAGHAAAPRSIGGVLSASLAAAAEALEAPGSKAGDSDALQRIADQIEAGYLARGQKLSREDKAIYADPSNTALALGILDSWAGNPVKEAPSTSARATESVLSANPVVRLARPKAPGVSRNPCIWESDIGRYKPARPHRSALWRSFAGKLVNTRQVGDEAPTSRTMWAVVDVIERAARNAGGKIEMCLAEMAKLARCCVDTAILTVHFLDKNRAIDRLTQMVTVDGKRRRGPNSYVLWLPDETEQEPKSPHEPEPSPEVQELLRFEEKKRRCGPLFDLVGRPWGLNRTPLSAKDMRSAASPRAARDPPIPA